MLDGQADVGDVRRHRADVVDAAGRVLTLGGVVIPADVGFATPSDGDVLSHALIDALAGAIGHGDIGSVLPRRQRSGGHTRPGRRRWMS